MLHKNKRTKGFVLNYKIIKTMDLTVCVWPNTFHELGQNYNSGRSFISRLEKHAGSK
jgi:hypothetical protein